MKPISLLKYAFVKLYATQREKIKQWLPIREALLMQLIKTINKKLINPKLLSDHSVCNRRLLKHNLLIALGQQTSRKQ